MRNWLPSNRLRGYTGPVITPASPSLAPPRREEVQVGGLSWQRICVHWPALWRLVQANLPTRMAPSRADRRGLSQRDGFGFHLVPDERMNFCANLDTVA